ncbi:hypothetical protein [Reyranella sp.]|uniref:hypothetical protein n=1 Tax=Reyranella sp. TaxID=1929291 RepID=UPI003BAD0644
MTGRLPRLLFALGLILAASGVRAANGIDVTRGADSTVYGTCVPSLVVENRSAETIDYLQVDVAVSLGGGRERTIELKSAYREGILYPISPGGKAVLKQHLDTSKALDAGCAELGERRVVRTICEAAGGKACESSVTVSP